MWQSATSAAVARRAESDETPFGYVVEYENGKATRVLAYLDPKKALEAAGLSE